MKRGVLLAVGAYVAWGILPIYWKALQAVPAMQIMCNRMVWSFFFLVLLIGIKKDWTSMRQAVSQPRLLLIYAVAAILLSVNWLVYIWGVNANYVVETSLGYYINPLVSVLLGVIILREKLRSIQWLSIGLAALGVIYLSFDYGSLPWIALVLAFTFASYSFVKKTAPLGSLHSLTLETGIMFAPAVLYLVYAQKHGFGAYGNISTFQTILLVLAGVVTTLPLLMFGSAARTIKLTTLGVLQYISPTIQFVLGVFVFGEPFTPARLVGFAIIWLALVIYSLEGIAVRRRAVLAPAD